MASPTGRQRPGGAFGPARDEARDARIIDAVLDLIVENGYADVTMGAVSERAGVAKATVYRRWASREDLVADALESLLAPVAPAEETEAGTLRDELVAALVHSSLCLQPGRHRLSVVLATASASHPEIAASLRERYIAGQRDAVASCLHRAEQRGEVSAERVKQVLAPGRLEVAAAVGILLQPDDFLGEPLDVGGVARVVDQVLLPLALGDSLPA